ncbi:MAG: alpha/beta hydrolase [Bacteroidota bacterium]
MSAQNWYQSGKTVPLQQLEVFYTEKGKGENLLCIHGFPTSSWDFEPMWEELADRYRVIASDLIGLGESDKSPKKISVMQQADILEALLQKLAIKNTHILAHDLGDTIAQELLARQIEGSSPILYKSCVFLNGGLFPETHRPRLIQSLLISPLGSLVAQLFTLKSYRRNMRQVFSPHFPPSEEFIQETWRLIQARDGLQAFPRLIRYMAERKKYRERWVGALSNSPIPLRLINGALDPVSGRHAGERYQTLIPEPDVVFLEKLGHYPHVENPRMVLDAFWEFHEKINASGSE